MAWKQDAQCTMQVNCSSASGCLDWTADVTTLSIETLSVNMHKHKYEGQSVIR